MEMQQLRELIGQSLEHERGGKLVYETAIQCVMTDGLREEFEKYLDETHEHIRILEGVCEVFGIDPHNPTLLGECVHGVSVALVEAMQKAKQGGDAAAVEVFACECVVLAETKDHLDWQLLKECVPGLSGEQARVLQEAVDAVEDQEDEHLYHSKGWCREVWLQSLGLEAVFPPPEERRDVRSAIAAARAEKARESMM